MTAFRRWGWSLALLLLPAVSFAETKPASIVRGSAKSDPAARSVEMFAAMQAGEIDVQILPKNAEEARVLVTNKTKQPLKIAMPAAFAAMPVLAQLGGGMGGNNRGGGMGGGNQGMGGGMGGGMMGGGMMGGGMGGMGGGGGFFNIAPERVAQVKVGLLCLEHGKKDPRPGVPYEIKPIETLTSNTAVHELLKNYANDRYPQRSAQAAAWHLNNHMSWEELAAKSIPHINRPSEPYFSRAELQAGITIAEQAKSLAEKNAKPTASASQSASK